MSPERNTVSLSSAVILSTFLIYFIFCYAAHLLTSRVERVPLPKIERPKSWSLNPGDIYAVISRPAADPNSNEEFCQKLKIRLKELQDETASIHCVFRDIQPHDIQPNAVDSFLKQFTYGSGISWFFLGNTDREHSISLGQFSHAWSFQGQLDEETWINESLHVFHRMIPGSSISRPKQIQSQRNYLLSFSVLIEDPAEANIQLNFKEVIDAYLQPMFAKIRPIFNTRVDSQIIYYADIADHVQTSDDGSTFLTQAQLEDFMGRTKWNVESIHTPSFPALHFFIYVPLWRHSPLLIKSDRDASMAFCIPRWGGLTIGNSLAKLNATADDFGSVMPVVLAQIRMMLGFPDPLWSNSDATVRQIVSDVGVADWEVRLIQRLRLQQNYHDGYDKLQALMRLLDENLQLPVQPHVGKLIEQAASNLEYCMQNVQHGSYDEAYDLCLDGYSAAHSAFFDETMLPLLYFPDEHVYAVYAPYFLSIFSVTISRTVQFIKSLRRKNPAAVLVS